MMDEPTSTMGRIIDSTTRAAYVAAARDDWHAVHNSAYWPEELRMYRYYLRRRPPGPGTHPGGAINTHSYDERRPVEALGGFVAWGYVEYAEPLAAAQIDAYELTEGIVT